MWFNFDLDYCLQISFISIWLCKCFLILTIYTEICFVNKMQPLTLNLRIVTGTGGFTVTWLFVAIFENLTKSVLHMVCLIWKFSRGGWRIAFLPGNTKWHVICNCLCSSINNAHFKVFWILILQLYNNPLRAPWKKYAKNELKSKHGSKELWIKLNNNHN